MKKNIAKITAIGMAFTLTLTGCALGGKSDVEPTSALSVEAITDVSQPNSEASTETSNASGEASSDEIIVVEDLEEPELEEAAPSEEASTDSSAEASTQYSIDKELKMVFFGDSQIANGRADGTDIASYVRVRVPNGVTYNLGIGGTTAALETSTTNYQDYENWSSLSLLGMIYALEGKVDRYRLLAQNEAVLNVMNQIDPSDVDYYFIEYGANDFFNKVQLDKYSAGTNILDIYTYYGALKMAVEELKALSPDATIVLITPFYGLYKAPDGTYLGDTYITSNGIATLQDYAKKINNVAEEYGLYCLDTMFRSKCDLYMDTADLYLMDNVHLSPLGRQVFGRIIAHIPNSMEGYEPSAYRQTEYIEIAKFNPDEYYKYDDELLASQFPEEYEKYINGEYLLAKPDEQ